MTLAILCIVFGSLLVINSGRDLFRYLRPSKDPQWWLYYHISRMIGSYIAAVTAFAVNQVGPRVSSDLQIWVWIGPALLFTPLIIVWNAYYRGKTKRNPMSSSLISVNLVDRTKPTSELHSIFKTLFHMSSRQLTPSL